MPIYEFHCEKCEKDSEILVRSSRWQGTRCPHCGAKKLSKKLSVFASSSASASTGIEGCPAGIPSCENAGSCGCACAGGAHHH